MSKYLIKYTESKTYPPYEEWPSETVIEAETEQAAIDDLLGDYWNSQPFRINVVSVEKVGRDE